MASRISASFFDARDVVFVGYSKRHAAYCAGIREALEKRGTKVHPVNPSPGEYDVKVYASIDDVPGSPELAIVATNKSRNSGLIHALAAKGVRRIAFASSVSADPSTLAACDDLGIEGAIVCPLQALGSGFHRFHGWIAGVPKAGVA